MANIITKRGSVDNIVTYEHICDSNADIANINPKYITLGSTCVVIQGDSGGLEVYIANNQKQWMPLMINSEEESAISFHVCSNEEVTQNGLPDIEFPSETTIYLVADSEDDNNLYSEFIYVDEDWERIGGATLDLTGYLQDGDIAAWAKAAQKPTYTAQEVGALPADTDLNIYATKTDTILNTTLSLGRKEETTIGVNSIALGKNVTASGKSAYAQGEDVIASGPQAHAEGYQTTASGVEAHAEGYHTTASGTAAHSEGEHTIASNSAAHAEGYGGTYVLNNITYTSSAVGMSDHTEGYQTRTAMGQPGNHAEGYQTAALGGASHAEGNQTIASGYQSHAEGANTVASGSQAHAEGYSTTASGSQAHAEGEGNLTLQKVINEKIYTGSGAYGSQAHSEGVTTWAIGSYSHAEGASTMALGSCAHAEGAGTVASGTNSHAEGGSTTASGENSHAEGAVTIASGFNSHAEGSYTVANHKNQHVFGEYTLNDTSSAPATARGTYIELVGNGTMYNRSNARTLDWDGNEVLSGKLTVGVGPAVDMDVTTKQYVDNSISDKVNSTNPIMTGKISAGGTATGNDAAALGQGSTANGPSSTAVGNYTVSSAYATTALGTMNVDIERFPLWVAGTQYEVGDKVRIYEDGSGFQCKEANNDDTFDSSKWDSLFENSEVVLVVGNGKSTAQRSNALTVEWDGDVRAKGDLYTGASADGKGGNKVATEAFVTTRIPTPPVADGTYTLQLTVSNGEATYSWI